VVLVKPDLAAGRSPAMRKAGAEKDVDAYRGAFQRLQTFPRFQTLSDEIRSVGRLKDALSCRNDTRAEWVLAASNRITGHFNRELRAFNLLSFGMGTILRQAHAYWSLVDAALEETLRAEPSACSVDFLNAFTASHLSVDDSQSVEAEVMRQSIRACMPSGSSSSAAPQPAQQRPRAHPTSGGGRDMAAGDGRGGGHAQAAPHAGGGRGRGRGAPAAPNAEVCHRCQRVGHRSRHCINPLVCGHCAAQDHDASTCPNR
jgi:hypothetical protein